MVYNATFNNISVEVCFNGGGNRITFVNQLPYDMSQTAPILEWRLDFMYKFIVNTWMTLDYMFIINRV